MALGIAQDALALDIETVFPVHATEVTILGGRQSSIVAISGWLQV